MQNNITFQKASAVGGLTGIARQIALPHEHTPQRFPSFPALERTAVMGFNAPASWPVPQAVNARAMLARQAAYPLWLAYAGGSIWSYMTTYMGLYLAGSVPNVARLSEALHSHCSGDVIGNTTRPYVTGGSVAPPSGYAVVGVDADISPRPFTWIPDNCTAGFVVGALSWSGTGVANVVFEIWDSPGESHLSPRYQVTIAAGATTNVSFFGSKGLWLRVHEIELTTTGSDVYVNVFATNSTVCTFTAGTPGTRGILDVTGGSAGTNSLIPAASSPEFANSALPWASARVTAVGALFTNVTQVLNKAGTVLCGRVNPAVKSPFMADSTYLSTLHPAEKQYLPLETGAYTYAPPSTDMAAFYDYSLNTSNGTCDPAPLYRLDNSALCNVLIFSSPSAAESIAINLDWHIEFRTTSTLFPIGLSMLTLEQLHQAQIALVAVGFFFPNSTHKAVLSKVASGVSTFLKQYLPAALPGPGAHLAKAATLMLSQRPVKTPPPTTAKGSGLVSGKVKAVKSKKKKNKKQK